jgi:type I restriction enzyme R subunit
VAAAEATIFTLMNEKQKAFIAFVLSKYIEIGESELDQSKLPILLSSMFHSQQEGIAELGGDVMKIRNLFVEFQQYLYKTA